MALICLLKYNFHFIIIYCVFQYSWLISLRPSNRSLGDEKGNTDPR
jgi:hypothetical protein